MVSDSSEISAKWRESPPSSLTLLPKEKGTPNCEFVPSLRLWKQPLRQIGELER